MADIRKKHERAWLVRWREGGKQRYKQFKTEAEALEFKKSVEPSEFDRRFGPIKHDRYGLPVFGNELQRHAVDDRLSTARYARRMLDADRDLRSTTRSLYDRYIRHYLEDTDLGHMDVREVQPADVSAWWAALRDTRTGGEPGPGTRRNARQLLARVFNRAVLVGDMDVSPLRRTPEIRRPRSIKRDNALSVAQLEKLAEAAGGGNRPERVRERDRLIILVMGFGGLRAGEVGGLMVDDVQRSGSRCRLRVSRAVIRETGKPAYVTDVKTDAGRRSVPIPCSVADEIEAYVARFQVEGHLFQGLEGALMARNDVAHAVTTAAKRAGLSGVHAHGLRHTAASIAVQAGANPEALRAMLGHTDVRITLGTYTHLYDWGADAVADTMERLREEHRNGGVEPGG